MTATAKILLATQANPGVMSAADKAKLDGVETGAQRNTAMPSDLLRASASANLMAGFTGAAVLNGTMTGATLTLDPTGGEYQDVINDGGSFAIRPPVLNAPANCASGVMRVRNGDAPGAIDLSAWGKIDGAFTQNADDKFFCFWLSFVGDTYISIKAL